MVHSTKFIENNSYSWPSRGMMNLGHAYFPPFLSLHCRIDRFELNSIGTDALTVGLTAAGVGSAFEA